MPTIVHMSALTDFRPEAFAAYLERLREDARLSQRGLATLADISHTKIGEWEKADGGAPHPAMLYKLATCLATSGTGDLDRRRRDDLYLALMRVAGYLPDGPGPSPDQIFREQLAQYWGTQAPEAQYLFSKLKDRSEKTKSSAIRLMRVLLDSE